MALISRHLLRPSRGRRVLLGALGVALPCALALGGCGDDGGSAASARGDTTTVARGGSGKDVAVTLPTRSTEFWRQFEAGLREAAQKGGLKLTVEYAELDANRQLAQVNGFVSRKVDAVLVAAPDAAGAAAAVQRAREANIPVFTAVETAGGVASHVASDDQAGGRVAATYLSTFLQQRGEVAVVGQPGARASMEREAGFRASLAPVAKTMPIVATVNGGGTVEGARAATDALLQANPGVDAIFATTEPHTLGALQAVMARGRQELVMVGYDPGPESLAAIKRESPLKAAVQQAPRELGMRALQVIAEHLSNEGVPSRLSVGVKLVTIDAK